MVEFKQQLEMKTISTGEKHLADEVKFYGEISPAMQAVAVKLINKEQSMAGIIQIEYIPQIVELLLNAYNTAKLNRKVNGDSTPETHGPDDGQAF